MEFQKSISKIIEERTSCRSFKAKKIDNVTLQKLIEYIAHINSEIKIKAKFLLIQNIENSGDTAEKLGTYGMITGASSYIIGIVDKDFKDICEFGYIFEKLILFATDLGLGTCWLGGTFNRSDFNQKAKLADNEYIPIVSPVGVKKESPRILESVVRAVIKADKRIAWDKLFFDNSTKTPLGKDKTSLYERPLEMLRLAPSASNKQPWRIIKSDNSYHFFLCRTKNYPMSGFDMQKNDLGIAMCHFELTAKELGIEGSFVYKKDVITPYGWEYMTTWQA